MTVKTPFVIASGARQSRFFGLLQEPHWTGLFFIASAGLFNPGGSGLQMGQNNSPRSRGQICPHSGQQMHSFKGFLQIWHISM
jgi:hypothetical protein